ncbi:hypothetical protein bpr_II112 (plasmid) [Butyrivibrio proteoclasticus B316]|uniref:Uncharacterized protein n=1 Tax=Butyrivibrio proteoclasticus (strain ATCC 51982 / DSM 14932 / B316) TaxID=515622 RepID=E0S3R9_BUTPB|nr:hypothetical protein [Butyrivibrio proteoclasticus]ADL36051.1 hypothetical protein bpr_II112 [Butyrivibrio proteoclasticus B316]
MERISYKQCEGHGQGSCKRCSDMGKWNVSWMSFLYKVDGCEGCYCLSCAKEMAKENN